MNTFRIVDQKCFVPSDLNDLPFWLDVKGELVWVSLEHKSVDGMLYDSVVVQKVVNNLAQAVWQRYGTDDYKGIRMDLASLKGSDKALFVMTPPQAKEMAELRNRPSQPYRRVRSCECEISQGEPCYCNLR